MTFWQSIAHLQGLERLITIASRSEAYSTTLPARRVVCRRLRRMGFRDLTGIVPEEWEQE